MATAKRARPPALRTIVQSVIAAAIGFAVVALVLVFLRSGDGVDEAEVAPDALSVREAVALPGGRAAIAVTGFVFVGENRTILCSARTGDPSYCDGSAIDLVGLDPNRLDLVFPDATDDNGDPYPPYSRDEVTVLGDYRLGALRVTDILG